MSDTQLIHSLQQQDTAAFRQFIALYKDRVFNTALSLVQHRQDAEDVTQEVFITVFQSVQQFSGRSGLATWVYRITVNKALEHHRKRRRKKRFAFLLPAEDHEDIPDFVHPGIRLEQREHAVWLFRAIDQLADNQKTAFILCHIEGLSYAEVSEIMELKVGAVESLLHRARQKLQKLLAGYYKQSK